MVLLKVACIMSQIATTITYIVMFSVSTTTVVSHYCSVLFHGRCVVFSSYRIFTAQQWIFMDSVICFRVVGYLTTLVWTKCMTLVFTRDRTIVRSAIINCSQFSHALYSKETILRFLIKYKMYFVSITYLHTYHFSIIGRFGWYSKNYSSF